jgi:hypothetical protein
MNRWLDEQAREQVRLFADVFIGRRSDYALQCADGR